MTFYQVCDDYLHQTGFHDDPQAKVRRRTRVCRHFPNEASCLRLVSAVLMEISDGWETGKAYLSFDD
jgi:transposase-like protein